MLPPLARLPNLERLVAQRGYFVIHAPRQTGKTTAMLALAQQLTASGQYTAIMVSVEVAAAFPQDLAGAERVIRQSWRNMAMNRLPDNLQPPPWPEAAPGQGIQSALQQWARSSPQPLVVLIDEIDVLQDINLSQGQPWLVNALAKAVVETVVPDPLQPITASHMEAAKEMLIQQRDTHVDSLMSILQEPRVRAVIEPMLAGQELNGVPNDNRQFLVDLGLVARSAAGGLVPANPIYREVLPRVLADGAQDSLPQIAPSWLTADGTLDGAKLLEAFLVFWRQHGQPLLKSAPYHEIAPHLVLMAFLHRVVNGGGTLKREYAIGSGRMNLCLRDGAVTLAIELKVWRDGQPDPLPAGLVQLDRYLAGLGLDTGWLVIFDRRSGLPPISDRTSTATAKTPDHRTITVIRG